MASKTIVFFSLYAQSNIYVFVQLKSVQGAFLPVDSVSWMEIPKIKIKLHKLDVCGVWY